MAKKGKPKNKAPSKTYQYYHVSGQELSRKKPFCPKCGPSYFLAEHSNRRTCGKCGYTEMVKQASSEKEESKKS